MGRSVKAPGYFILKTGVATFGLIFQFVLFKLFGSDFTGNVNRIQIWALFLSFLVFPGIEFSILRTFPRIRKDSPDEYLFASRQAKILIVWLTLIISILLLVIKLFNDGLATTFSVLIALAYILFLSRTLPIIYRIEDKYYYSVSAEQGAIFIIATPIAFILSHFTVSPTTFWMVTILAYFVVSAKFLDLQQEKKRITSTLHHRPQGLVWRSLRADYCIPVALIAISNFALLWLPATVGTFLLSPEDIATSVSMMRLVGLLLFVESAMSAFFLPKISAEGRSAMRSDVFLSFRRYITFGTFIVTLATGFLLIWMEPFGFGRKETIIFSLVAIAQLLVCSVGSPFTMATVIMGQSSLSKMSNIMIIMSTANIIVLIIFPRWETIIIGFAALQLLKAAFGSYILKSHRDDP